MGISLLLESLSTAASVGMGCGTCCGSSTSIMLYGYLTTHARDIKQSLRAFFSFFLGKLLAVVLLCCAASLLGRQILGEDGRAFGVPVALVVDGFMILMGIWLLIGWFRERYGKKGCKSCKHCSSQNRNGTNDKNGKKPSRGLLLGMGFGYGISPCAPLLLIAGYAATLPAGYAAALGCVFAAASTISPTLLFLLLSGVLAGKMRKEIPTYLTWFRLACYLLFIALFTISFLKEL